MARGAEAESVYRLFQEAKLGAGEWEGGCTTETGVLGNAVLKMRKAWECFVPWEGLTMLGTSWAEGVIEQVPEKRGWAEPQRPECSCGIRLRLGRSLLQGGQGSHLKTSLSSEKC